jgi:hypothetical protein
MRNSEMIQSGDLSKSVTKAKFAGPLPKGGLKAADDEFRRGFIHQALLEAGRDVGEGAMLCKLPPTISGDWPGN